MKNILFCCFLGAVFSLHAQIPFNGYNVDLAPFYHGVASGDPRTTDLLIWTRVTPDNNQASINGEYFVALDTAFTTLVQSGNFVADSSKDFTVKLLIGGLTPGTTYYYYFRALGKNSLIGRAKTCPTGAVGNLKFAVVSCANYEGGYFNVYGAIAERNDLDAILHLGDYIYEYAAGSYGVGIPGRLHEPANEILSLSDYRTRYAHSRLDPYLIRLHQQHTMISIWDDHETANDSWSTGAQNHQSNEGPWETRKAIGKRVYFEWMPIRDNPDTSIYRKLSYGNLCDVFMLDTRLEGRVEPPAHFDTPDTPPRNIMSQTQFDWLSSNLKSSTAQWKVIGNQILFSSFNVGFAAGFNLTNIDSVRYYEDLFIDNWESYPTQRNALIDSIRQQNIDNVVIMSGDSHCSWAFDVTQNAVLYPLASAFNIPQANPFNPTTGQGYDPITGDGSWAVEFGVPSVSSANFDELINSPSLADQVETYLNSPIPVFNVNYNPHLKYVDLDRQGYVILDLKQDSAQADYYYVPDIKLLSTNSSFGKAMYTLNNQNRLKTGTIAAAPKADPDIPTPLLPKGYVSSIQQPGEQAFEMEIFPNPVQGELHVRLNFKQETSGFWTIQDVTGKTLRQSGGQSFKAGNSMLNCSVAGLPEGIYVFSFVTAEGESVSRQIMVRE